MFQYGRVNTDFPVCTIQGIYNIEIMLFRQCGLGLKFRTALIDALHDYSTKPSYAPDTTYLINMVVEYRGYYYISLQTVGVNILPSNKVFWALAPKFDAPDYEEFWCAYLAEYIALHITKKQIPFALVAFKAEGLVMFNGVNYSTAEKDSRHMLYVAINSSISMVYENMEFNVKEENADNALFADTKFLNITCCASCGCLPNDCECKKRIRKQYGYKFG